MEDQLRFLVALAFAGLLIMLRLDAERFGAAEYEADQYGQPATIRRRFAWYVLGPRGSRRHLFVHPIDGPDLLLARRRPARAVLGGLALRPRDRPGGQLRDLPLPPDPLPGQLVVPGRPAQLGGHRVHRRGAFRGALFGLLSFGRVNPTLANLAQAIIYTLTTRLGAPGRDRYLLVLTLGIGLIGRVADGRPPADRGPPSWGTRSRGSRSSS